MSEDNTALPEPTFEQKVWDTLSDQSVEDHVEWIEATAKRPAIPYLPWHKAWLLVKRKFPGSTYSHRPDLWHPDQTVEVEVDVIISDGTNQVFTNSRLAVMDRWFNPIANPNARNINDARQRCLVKALAFNGLGLNLWTEQILIPVGALDEPIDETQLAELEKLINETETDVPKFLKWCKVEELNRLPYERYGSALRLLETKKRRQEAPKKKAAAKKAAK